MRPLNHNRCTRTLSLKRTMVIDIKNTDVERTHKCKTVEIMVLSRKIMCLLNCKWVVSMERERGPPSKVEALCRILSNKKPPT